MIGAIFRRFIIGLVFASVGIANGEAAGALTYNDILGRWCGAKTNPNWTNLLVARDKLTITHLPGKVVNVLKIDHFSFTETQMTIHYFAAGALEGVRGKNLFHVDYGNLSADGKSMVQLHNEVQPSDYNFTRC
jgi:hypothetical protein